jgi:ferritin-like metal-binding protein YciE
MNVSSLSDLFLEELKDIHNAEKQLVKAIPKMIRSATNEELQKALSDHLEETKTQVSRLEEVLEDLGAGPGRKKCRGMQGIVEEAEELLGEIKDEATRDSAIIACAQRVEHYEIAAYGCARAFAEQLEHTEAAAVLQSILDEESNADKRLTDVAESMVNAMAAQVNSEEESE